MVQQGPGLSSRPRHDVEANAGLVYSVMICETIPASARVNNLLVMETTCGIQAIRGTPLACLDRFDDLLASFSMLQAPHA